MILFEIHTKELRIKSIYKKKTKHKNKLFVAFHAMVQSIAFFFSDLRSFVSGARKIPLLLNDQCTSNLCFCVSAARQECT